MITVATRLSHHAALAEDVDVHEQPVEEGIDAALTQFRGHDASRLFEYRRST
jgi:hypothetical protein